MMIKKDIKMRNFFLWLKENIADLNDITKTKIAHLPNFGKSLMASRKIEKNEIILEIPQNLFLSMENAFQDKLIKKLILSKNLYLEKKTIFAFFIYIQLKIKEKSFWHSYLQILPTDYDNILMWPIEEIKLLKRKDLVDVMIKKKEYVENEFAKLKEILMRSDEEFLKQIQIEDFFKIFSLIESRTLYYQNSSDGESAIGALVPYYDFCNHTFLKDVNAFDYFYYDKVKKKYVLKAYKQFEENEQIFICYGNYNNLHFLELYGFIPFENVFNNFITIRIKMDLKAIFGMNLKKILEDFEKKIEIIKKILPHFCRKNALDKKKIELEDFVNIQIEERERKTSFSWEIERFFYILSLNSEEIFKKNIETFIFNAVEEEMLRNSEYKLFFYDVKEFLLNEVYGLNKTEVLKELEQKKNNKEYLAKKYLEYEVNLIKSLEFGI